MIEYRSRLRPLLAEKVHVLIHALLADEYATTANLECGVVRKELRDFVPHGLVHVVSVGPLQALHLYLIVQETDFPREGCKVRWHRAHIGPWLGMHNRIRIVI